ncbi:hypothetical protein DM01DRAFT_1383343 [Hesseltinella vesiculosa]|uniref:Uncharacterized protein n=1 Tax=Hesseltinella vesiculosa TaxID=101127 RepID=A0A1X2GHD8_9FUNG|nr:hypothetical protein DM01DRAFT_1383343 [Hesseltinella vesiculosa]
MTQLTVTELKDLAAKLPKANDRQRYVNIIEMSSKLQRTMRQLEEKLDIIDTAREIVSKTSGASNNDRSPPGSHLLSNVSSCSSSLSSHLASIPPIDTQPATSISVADEQQMSNHRLCSFSSSIGSEISFVFPDTPDDDLPEDTPFTARPHHDTIYETAAYYYNPTGMPPLPLVSALAGKKPSQDGIKLKRKVTFAKELVTATLRRSTDSADSDLSSSSSISSLIDSHVQDSSFLLMTPPESPHHPSDPPTHPSSPSTTSSYPLLENPLPLAPVIHVQKKINGLRGLITRTYQLNEIISSRTTISDLGLFNAVDSTTGKAKAVLRVVMTSQLKNTKSPVANLDRTMLQMFGFTFYVSLKRSPHVKRPPQDDPRCLVVSDHIVTDALYYWTQHQSLPLLHHATHILRESVKVYVIYDKAHLLKPQVTPPPTPPAIYS